MADPALRPRERRRNRLRDEIARIALDLFEEKGYDNVTIDQIAESADVSPRTFFRYFATKQETLWPAHEQQLALFRELLWTGPANQSLFGSIRRAMTEIAQFYEEDYDAFVKRTAIMRQSPSLWSFLRELQQPWADEIAELAAERLGIQASDPLPRLIGASCVASQEVALKMWIQSAGKQSYAALTEEMVRAAENLSSAVSSTRKAKR